MSQRPPQIFIELQAAINGACRIDDAPQVWLSRLDPGTTGQYNSQLQQIFICDKYYPTASRIGLGSVYLHEVAHHLTAENHQSHGPVFGSIFGALLIRWLGYGGGVRLYDVEDQDLDPELFQDWQKVQLDFCNYQAHRLAALDCQAADLVEHAAQAWAAWREKITKIRRSEWVHETRWERRKAAIRKTMEGLAMGTPLLLLAAAVAAANFF